MNICCGNSCRCFKNTSQGLSARSGQGKAVSSWDQLDGEKGREKLRLRLSGRPVRADQKPRRQPEPVGWEADVEGVGTLGLEYWLVSSCSRGTNSAQAAEFATNSPPGHRHTK